MIYLPIADFDLSKAEKITPRKMQSEWFEFIGRDEDGNFIFKKLFGESEKEKGN